MALLVHNSVVFLLLLLLFVSVSGQEICSRQYNNRILLGAIVNSREPADSGKECLSKCLDARPKCKAAVYFEFFNGEKRICQLYTTNSKSPGIAMAFESPAQQNDLTTLYEILENCTEKDEKEAHRLHDISEKNATTFETYAQQRAPCGKIICNQGCPGTVVATGCPQLPPVAPSSLPLILPQTDWNGWTEWTACSTSCGQGQKTRTRTCSSTTIPCSSDMAASTETQFCESAQCAVWGEWTPLTPCSASCGQGTQTRTRGCSVAGQCIGGPAQEMQTCFFNACPTWTEWCEWSTCSVSCNEGLKTRTRVCPSLDFGGGKPQCEGAGVQSEPCSEVACPTWSEWCAWSSCSCTCGSGEQTRSRTCQNGFSCAGPSISSQRCDNPPCPQWTEWGNWGVCTASCGLGTQERTRQCQNGANCGWGSARESRLVDAGPCPMWSIWGFWCECSASCGGGQQSRTRECLTGGNCPGNALEGQSCNTQPCPSWTPWCEWSPCTASCGAGNQVRSRTCQGGLFAVCQGPAQDQQPCNGPACPTWGEWCPWSPCGSTCGPGQQTRARQCLNIAGCGDGLAQEMKFCDQPACPQPQTIAVSCGCSCGQCPTYQCQWAAWGEWGACDPSGSNQRTRSCKGGAVGEVCECPGLSIETKQCSPVAVAENVAAENVTLPPVLPQNEEITCDWSAWGLWSICGTTCGGGTHQRTRICGGGDFSGKKPCRCSGESVETESCGKEPCPTSDSNKAEESIVIPLEGAIINSNGRR